MTSPENQKIIDDLEAIASEHQVLKAVWHDGREFLLARTTDGYWLSIPDLDGEHNINIMFSEDLQIQNVSKSKKIDTNNENAVIVLPNHLPKELVGRDFEIFDAFIQQAAQQQLASTKPSIT
jgi:hypothetical protein